MFDDNINITNRDLLLFKYLLESKFLTRDQIRKYIYQSNSYGTKRLWQLSSNKYITKVRSPLGKAGQTVVLADKKALDCMYIYESNLRTLKRKNNFSFYLFDPADYILQTKLDLRQFEHDMYVNTIRFVLENHGASKWLSYVMINRKKQVNNFRFVPDGLFQNNSLLCAVEFENRLKNKQRYSELFNHFYSKDKRINYVIYITGTDLVYNSLFKLITPSFIKESPDSYKKFYLLRLYDLMQGNLIISNPYDSNLRFNLCNILS